MGIKWVVKGLRHRWRAAATGLSPWCEEDVLAAPPPLATVLIWRSQGLAILLLLRGWTRCSLHLYLATICQFSYSILVFVTCSFHPDFSPTLTLNVRYFLKRKRTSFVYSQWLHQLAYFNKLSALKQIKSQNEKSHWNCSPGIKPGTYWTEWTLINLYQKSSFDYHIDFLTVN